MSIVKVEKLCKNYGAGENIVQALVDVDLTVEEGEFIAVVGSSGSGKSTLLHILGGVDTPTTGKVLIDGEDYFSLNDEQQSIFRRQKVGLIYQFYNLIPTLSVKENILLPIMLDKGKYDELYLNDLINMLGLQQRIEHLPNQLSGGQQQRVSIGRALMIKPSILLADEPTGNLDSKNSMEIMKLLKECNEKYNQTIVMVTHDKEFASHAKRIITIEDGRIVKDELVKHESTK